MFNKELIFSTPSWAKLLDYVDVNELLAKEVWLGDELEVHGYDLDKHEMERVLSASDSYTMESKYNVVRVVGDGSITGLEVLTMARQTDPLKELKMSKGLFDTIEENGYYMGRECGWHTHIMMNVNQQIKIPETVFRNFTQLFRLFMPTLVMLTKATARSLGDYSKIKPLMALSGLNSSNGSVKHLQGIGRYLAINVGAKGYYSDWGHSTLQPMSDDEMRGIHWEVRTPDCHFSPVILVAWHDIIRTIVRKAIEFSEHGILKISSTNENVSLCDISEHTKIAKFWDEFNKLALKYFRTPNYKYTLGDSNITRDELMEYTTTNIDLLLDLFGVDFHEITKETLIKTKTKPYLMNTNNWDNSIIKKCDISNLGWYKIFRGATRSWSIKAKNIKDWWVKFCNLPTFEHPSIETMKIVITKEGYVWNPTNRNYFKR